ncbi:hypothetical protein QD357_11610 [Rhizobium sp. BR 317]|uniref:hypothetical protein n=1 Tax=Rhizobium sp. BR 317 TaxID=3040015 RepID=UPI0039BFCCE1
MLIAVFAFAAFPQCFAAESKEQEAQPSDITEKSAKECFDSFARLPINKRLEQNNPDMFEPTFLRIHKDLYSSYDKKCLYGWGSLHDYTREFLGENVGGLFSGNDPSPFCVAFRVTNDAIATAGHCPVSPGATAMRLYGHPGDPITVGDKIVVPQGDAQALPDLGDYALYRLRGKVNPSRWTPATFTRSIADHQAILIVAPSRISPRAIADDDVEKWLEEVRFSRMPSNQISLPGDVQPLVPNGLPRTDCLFHQSPTLFGMSGAPIVAITVKPGAEPIFHVIGIHLRNGFKHDDPRKKGCGAHYPYNVGIRIPAGVMAALQSGTLGIGPN